MQKTAQKLAKEYDFETEFEFYDYIVDSYVNGQKKQSGKLFTMMEPNDQKHFLCEYLNFGNKTDAEVLKFCVTQLINK